jgi:hypothetical protein
MAMSLASPSHASLVSSAVRCLLRKSESLIVRTTVFGVIAKAEHTIRPALDCSAP